MNYENSNSRHNEKLHKRAQSLLNEKNRPDGSTSTHQFYNLSETNLRDIIMLMFNELRTQWYMYKKQESRNEKITIRSCITEEYDS